MKLWGGNYTGGPDAGFWEFNRSFPFDRRLVNVDLLTPAEVAWLNAYHARVSKLIGPELGPEDRAWLEAATARIG